MAHDFAEKEMRPVAWEYDKDGTWPEDVLRKAWELGLMNVHIEEAYGGAGASFLPGAPIGGGVSWGRSRIPTPPGAHRPARAPGPAPPPPGAKKKDPRGAPR